MKSLLLALTVLFAAGQAFADAPSEEMLRYDLTLKQVECRNDPQNKEACDGVKAAIANLVAAGYCLADDSTRLGEGKADAAGNCQ